MSDAWNTENPWLIQSPGVLRLNSTSITIERCARHAPIMWMVMHQGIRLRAALSLSDAKEYALKEVHTLIEVGIEP